MGSLRQLETTQLTLKRLGIHTARITVVYLSEESELLKNKGFDEGIRVRIRYKDQIMMATLNVVSAHLLQAHEASLSEATWRLLKPKAGDTISLFYAEPLPSLGYIHKKISGKSLTYPEMFEIVKDTAHGYLSEIHLSAFLTATSAGHLSLKETIFLTQAMLKVGKQIHWPTPLVVDKHCIGGIPGNRTTLIVVPIVAAFGLTIPKSSSRSITSSAGTADTMEVLAPVNLSFEQIQRVVEKEHGCIVWGGTSDLSPADEAFIIIERQLSLDSSGQIVASILSKKAAAGSNHLVMDIPFGSSAKVKTLKEAKKLKMMLERVGAALGIEVKAFILDGSQPVGYGIGPALEARDILAILKNEPQAHARLRERALKLAGYILEFSPQVKRGTGYDIAKEILISGKAWEKFQAICEAQGGLRTPPIAPYQKTFSSVKPGYIVKMDNLRLAQLAKLAGAPENKSAGVYVHSFIGDLIKIGQPLLTVHAETQEELDYAFRYLKANMNMVLIQ